MIPIALTLGYLGDCNELSRYDLAGQSISEVFSNASSGDIALALNCERMQWPRRFNAIADSLSLHYALDGLVGWAPKGLAVGLVFGRRYLPYRNALGVMFDRGFATWDDPVGGRSDFSVPRQGCAVFLDPIAELRGLGTVDFFNEAIYTAIHELGHVFNLVHNFNEPNFMAGSDRAIRGTNFYRFTHADELFLGMCSINPQVRPGGTPFRGRDQAWSRVSGEDETDNVPVLLEISTGRHRLLPFDPLELDIRVRASETAGEVVIPDEIDPGYARFRIWIEYPSGEKRLYRSPRHYCPTGRIRTLTHEVCFERDVSIFGQSGGFTFSEPGVYRVYAELHLSQNVKVISNSIQLEVLPMRDEWKHQSLLGIPSIARLLYYRVATSRSTSLRRLQEHCLDRAGDDNSGILDYTIGRIYAKQSVGFKTKASRTHYANLATKCLQRAADHPMIGSNAQRVAIAILEELQH